MGAGEKGFHRARLLPAEDRNAFLAESGDAEVRSLLEAQEQASSLEDDPVTYKRQLKPVAVALSTGNG